MNLTGSKQGDIETLMQMDDMTLSRICQVNRHFRDICNDDNFWLRRFYTTYPKLSENGDFWLNFKRTQQYPTYKYVGDAFKEVVELYTWKDIYNNITAITGGDDHFPTVDDANRIASMYGKLSLLNFLENLGVLPDSHGADDAGAFEDTETLQWLFERDIEMSDAGVQYVINNELEATLDWYDNRYGEAETSTEEEEVESDE